jgi:crossover junction endodeoxyribonuclease RuvC
LPRKTNRALWANYLTEKKPTRPANPGVSALAPRQSFRGRILGFDPSLRGSGLAILDYQTDRARVVHSETLKFHAKESAPACMGMIHQRVSQLIKDYHPDVAAVEAAIFVQNLQTAILLGSARGAGLAAIAQAGLEIFEYPPLRIKQAIVGYGRASKEQVAAMLHSLAPGFESTALDETDAAAVALCHALSYRGPAS